MAKPIALFGSSMNPAGTHHRTVVECLIAAGFMVKIIPCGLRPDKDAVKDTPSHHRAEMVNLTFGDLVAPGNAEIDLFDIANGTFTRAYALQARYEREGELWHSVGTDLTLDGREGRSPIHSWERGPEIWETFNFVVGVREGIGVDPRDLPPHHRLIYPRVFGSSELIRAKVAAGESLEGLVLPAVEAYIARYGLYRPASQ